MTTSPTTGAETISDDLSKDLNPLIAGISSQQITRSILFASWALFLYDHALVFDVEVERIWKTRWTPVKCAYIAMRVCNITFLVGNIHLDFAPNMTTTVCRVWFITAGSVEYVALSLTTWLILLRVLACYNKLWSKRLFTMLIIAGALVLFMNVMYLKDLIPNIVYVFGSGCVPTNKPSLWQYSLSSGEGLEEFRGRQLIPAVFHNSTVYFLFVLSVSFVTILYINVGPVLTRASATILSGTLATIAICRSILDLRTTLKEFADQTNDPDWTNASELASLPPPRRRTPSNISDLSDFTGLDNRQQYHSSRHIPVFVMGDPIPLASRTSDTPHSPQPPITV